MTTEPTMRVLVYSDDVDTRERVKTAVGRRPAAGLPEVEWLECATEKAVIAAFDAGAIEVAILDGEATPAGGMGIARQVKDEIYRCPGVLLLTGGVDDDWLAGGSRGDAVVPYAVDRVVLAEGGVDMLHLGVGTLA